MNIINPIFKDILSNIFTYLNTISIRSLQLTCKYLQKLIEIYVKSNNINMSRLIKYAYSKNNFICEIINCSDEDADVLLKTYGIGQKYKFILYDYGYYDLDAKRAYHHDGSQVKSLYNPMDNISLAMNTTITGRIITHIQHVYTIFNLKIYNNIIKKYKLYLAPYGDEYVVIIDNKNMVFNIYDNKYEAISNTINICFQLFDKN